MSRRGVLGIDLGTSGVKVVLWDELGGIAARASREYRITVRHSGWAEADPLVWWRAVRDAVLEVTSTAHAEVVGVGVAGQMHGMVMVDGDGLPVRAAMLWPDERAGREAERWRALATELRERLANPIAAGMMGPMLLWVREHEPDSWRRVRSVMLPKDWIRSMIVGDFPATRSVTDPTDASATLLWDLEADDWAVDIVEQLGFDPAHLMNILPAVESSVSVVGSAVGLRDVGVGEATPVVVGAGDAAATVHALETDSGLLLVAGTGMQVIRPGLALSSIPDRLAAHNYRAVKPGTAFAMAALLNGGLALDWVRSTLGASWDELYSARDASSSDRLPLFVPWLAPERLPARMAGGAGQWLGLGFDTDRKDLLAAAVEGVAFAVARHIRLLRGQSEGGVYADQLLAVGGGVRSGRFCQLLSDVVELPVRVLDFPDTTAIGAAGLAWEAVEGSRPPPPIRGVRQFSPVADRSRAERQHAWQSAVGDE